MGAPVLRALMDAFGQEYYETNNDHNFNLGPDATIYVRKAARQPHGVQPYARIKQTTVEKFPNGLELRGYINRNRILRDTNRDDYLIFPEHIDAIIAILQGG